MAKDAMIGLAKLSSAVLGTSTMANGFAVTPTGPASLQVVCAPGEIYSLTSIDALAYSTLPADTTHSIMKQGILLDGVTLSCPAPGTTGQSINYLVQVTYQDSDSTPVLLPYYNSANPALPYSGMGNNGLTQNTNRKGIAVVAVKAGASAVTGSQVTPAPDAGYIGLYVVTVAFGQTTITGASIAQYSGAPMLPSGLLQAVQNGATAGAIDIGTANAYAANFTPAITALTDRMMLCIKATNANTTASTFTPAPGVIAPSPIVGGAHAALQGGEVVASGDLWLQWNSSIGAGSWVLVDSTGGGQQIAPATKSQHAIQLGQATGRLLRTTIYRNNGGTLQSSVDGAAFANVGSTFVAHTSAIFAEGEVLGGGASGANAAATGAGQISAGPGGGAGGWSYKRAAIASFNGATIVVGAGGTSSANQAGGTSAIGALISATGGLAVVTGPAATATGIPFGISIGGTGSGGDINADGGVGDFSLYTTTPQSGTGGSSRYGAGPSGVGGVATTGAVGNNAASPGCGGSGAACGASVAAPKAGGAGAPGLVTIREWA